MCTCNSDQDSTLNATSNWRTWFLVRRAEKMVVHPCGKTPLCKQTHKRAGVPRLYVKLVSYVKTLCVCFYVCHIALSKQTQKYAGVPRTTSKRGCNQWCVRCKLRGFQKISSHVCLPWHVPFPNLVLLVWYLLDCFTTVKYVLLKFRRMWTARLLRVSPILSLGDKFLMRMWLQACQT